MKNKVVLITGALTGIGRATGLLSYRAGLAVGTSMFGDKFRE